MPDLRIIPLGGMSSVTQNMFLYEYDNELLMVDCGIGFPDVYMPGVDVLIPDITYLKQLLTQGKTLVGLILTHGHEDHIGAAPYVFDELPDFPIFAAPLTAGFTKKKLEERGTKKTFTIIDHQEPFRISNYFSAQAIQVTHSVPQTRHYAITTPSGVIYHGSDFKFDLDPVDGKKSNTELMAKIGAAGVKCLLIDCLRVEQPNWSKPETAVGPVIEETMSNTQGKYIITLMSSHIHRIQQTVDAAIKHKRKVVFVGRSVEQNIEIALELGVINIPRDMMVDKHHILDYRDEELCVIIAGSQGQEGSSLMRAVYGEHQIIQIKPHDTVVFSANAIPGNEIPYFGAIDELSRNGVHVLYPDIMPNLHQSGHASAPEQQELVKLIKAEYIIPVGGADRHRHLFFEKVAADQGYVEKNILTPTNGEILAFTEKGAKVAETITLRPQLVDGLGVGDVGPVVLSDRRALGQAGIIVLVIPKHGGYYDAKAINVVSRGFVFMKDADEVIEFIKRSTAEVIAEAEKSGTNEDTMKRTIEKRLARKLYKVIRREPMIVPVIVSV